jgi:predicted transcriptional regulator
MNRNDGRPVSERFLSGLIKARLWAVGVTQGQIAAAVGVTPALVSMVIAGKRKNDRVMQAILEATDGVCEYVARAGVSCPADEAKKQERP